MKSMEKELYEIDSEISQYPIYVVATSIEDAVSKYNNYYSGIAQNNEMLTGIKRITNKSAATLIL